MRREKRRSENEQRYLAQQDRLRAKRQRKHIIDSSSQLASQAADRAINQIDAGLSAEVPFINVSSAAELLLYLELAASTLEETRQIPSTSKLTWH
jgi:hypothetical protein